MLLRFVGWMLSANLLAFCSGTVCSQSYPNKPIRIVTVGIGGAPDFTARVIAQGLTGSLGRQVIVDNRGSGFVPAEVVSKAQPDGYTLLVNAGTLWIVPLMQQTPYDPVRDFSPISLAVNSPNLIVVHPSLPVKSVKELIDLAKAKPGELNFASGATGGANHLAAELFKSMAGVNIVRINFKGSALALNALIGGELQLMFPTAGSVAPHLKSGRLMALAVASAQPSALAPGLPTVAASGLPGYESGTIISVFAPAKTPATIVDRLNQEIVRILNRADVKETFSKSGVETVASSPEQLAATIKSEMARMGKVIREAGIRAE